MAGSIDGRIDVFDFSGGYIDSLENAHDMPDKSDANPIYSICALKEGFALTGKNTVTIYKVNTFNGIDLKSQNQSINDLTNSKTLFSSSQYKILKKLKLTNDDSVIVSSLVKNASEDELVCYTSNNQFFFVDLYKCEESVLVSNLYFNSLLK